MKTLDKQKPYGSVYGDEFGRCYEQGGVHFDAQGNEWVDPTPTQPAPSAPPSEKKPK